MTDDDPAAVLRHRLNNKLAGLLGNLDVVDEILRQSPSILAAATIDDRVEIIEALRHVRNCANEIVALAKD